MKGDDPLLAEHRKSSAKVISCKVLTVSDTRTIDTDKSGKLLKELLHQSGHAVAEYEIVKDDISLITAELEKAIHNQDIQAVLLNGGTGISKRDVTIEAVKPLLDKELVGFGELFRFLSYRDDIGSAAILSRAIAGVSGDTVIFSMPGSSGAVKLAMEQLIIPEIGHIANELTKDSR
ncbi:MULTISPECIES: MogA/MoaB family molybdenum cofactor biosynthesis protein [Rossellomorea]|uniref:MogA/MoaB family molybdenum cofactor biosynthesis protein n=1 Tax=Rossellomorea TaxID=2837508 RepID=UPI001CC9EA20|nr:MULTISPECIES: MogA/MoaB family molybdenum cofactor biosynthesis protein [Rossellomorea]MCA0150982.1 MogA/MoaB family molybdenum cofactor biosynthesis protein [Rossellomorea vietnamensis]UTE76913.1 MogA/MoaB family molybdenum cofactor biosynthesis protein [Rossellomorea sp. KS-H15a]WGG44827.1 MogA/MoaB family molybdenum cofactor biosynthesis protein [Rossellomorea sp. DA94]